MNALFRFKRNTDGTALDLHSDEIKKKFIKWLKTRDTWWVETNKSDYIIFVFVNSYDGLDSSINEEQKYKLVTLLKPIVYDAKYQ